MPIVLHTKVDDHYDILATVISRANLKALVMVNELL